MHGVSFFQFRKNHSCEFKRVKWGKLFRTRSYLLELQNVQHFSYFRFLEIVSISIVNPFKWYCNWMVAGQFQREHKQFEIPFLPILHLYFCSVRLLKETKKKENSHYYPNIREEAKKGRLICDVWWKNVYKRQKRRPANLFS